MSVTENLHRASRRSSANTESEAGTLPVGWLNPPMRRSGASYLFRNCSTDRAEEGQEEGEDQEGVGGECVDLHVTNQYGKDQDLDDYSELDKEVERRATGSVAVQVDENYIEVLKALLCDLSASEAQLVFVALGLGAVYYKIVEIFKGQESGLRKAALKGATGAELFTCIFSSESFGDSLHLQARTVLLNWATEICQKSEFL